MGSFANNSKWPERVKLAASVAQPVLVLLTEAELYYSAKLLNLSPYDFKTPEEFLRKWQFYKGSLEAVNDLTNLIKGQMTNE